MDNHAWHKTKIVCTLGPATDAPGVIEGLISAGLDVARINMSHGSHDDHARRISLVRAEARRLRQPVAILCDLPGPKFRLATLPDGALTLHEGADVALTAARTAAATALPIRNPELIDALANGDAVYLADGAVELRVTRTAPDAVSCTVVAGGVVRSGSGINVPTASLGNLVPTPEDRRHIAFALSHRVEWLGVSFVQTAEDLEQVRRCFGDAAPPLLMAKIEKRRALDQLDAVIEAADGVMVARGDLGVETDLAEIPLVQKRIIAAANARARPVITATQMLESMIEHERPTRAEVTDVANAVLDGTDAVMLSGETAVGRHPVAAVQILNRVLAATEEAYGDAMSEQGLKSAPAGPSDALGFVACQLGRRLGAAAIVSAADDLMTATNIARFRPGIPVILVASDATLASAMSMVRSVVPLSAAHGSTADCLHAARQWLLGTGRAAEGAKVVLVSGTGVSRTADTLHVATI